MDNDEDKIAYDYVKTPEHGLRESAITFQKLRGT